MFEYLDDLIEDYCDFFYDYYYIPGFDSICFLFVLIFGGISGIPIIFESFNAPEPYLWYATGMCYCFISAEIIFSEDVIWRALLRCLILAVIVGALFFIGKFLTLLIAVLFMFVLLFAGAVGPSGLFGGSGGGLGGFGGGGGFGGAGGGSAEKEYWITNDDGHTVRLFESGVRFRGSDGNFYGRNMDGTFFKE